MASIVQLIRQRHCATRVTVVVVLSCALAAACETSSSISQGPSPIKCQLTLTTAAAIEADGGAGSLAITTQPECAWEAAATVNWISALSPANGQGTATVSFRVAANDGAASRDGAILVNGEQARVSQLAPCRFDISPSSYGTGASGATSSVSIATESHCTWAAASNAAWLTVTSPATGNGSGTVGFAIAPNTGETRIGTIAIASQRVVVTQAAGVPPPPPPPPPPSPSPPPPPPACTYSLSRTSDFVPANEGAGSVDVSTTSTCRWTAVSHDSWLFVSSGAAGAGNGTVEYRFTTNTGEQRGGTLTIGGLTFQVTQGRAP